MTDNVFSVGDMALCIVPKTRGEGYILRNGQCYVIEKAGIRHGIKMVYVTFEAGYKPFDVSGEGGWFRENRFRKTKEEIKFKIVKNENRETTQGKSE